MYYHVRYPEPVILCGRVSWYIKKKYGSYPSPDNQTKVSTCSLTSSLSRPRLVRFPPACCSHLEPRDSPTCSSPLQRRRASPAVTDGERSSLEPSSQEVTAATVSRLYFLAASRGSSSRGGEKAAVAQPHPLRSSSSVSWKRPPPPPPPPPARQEEVCAEPTRS
jgi:hypothetical protein